MDCLSPSCKRTHPTPFEAGCSGRLQATEGFSFRIALSKPRVACFEAVFTRIATTDRRLLKQSRISTASGLA